LQNYEASEIQISQLKLELEKSQQNLAKLRSEFDFPKENSSDIGFCIMQKRRELDEIKIESKEIIKKQEIELENINKEIRKYKENEVKLNLHIQNLTLELEQVLRKNKSMQCTRKIRDKRSLSMPNTKKRSKSNSRSSVINKKIYNTKQKVKPHKTLKNQSEFIENTNLLNKENISKKEETLKKISKLNNEISEMRIEDIGNRLNTLKNILNLSKLNSSELNK